MLFVIVTIIIIITVFLIPIYITISFSHFVYSFTLILTTRYENCREVRDPIRAADKYVNIVFAVNTQSHDSMTFQEFRSLLLMQPQISTFLQVVDLQEEM